MNDNEMLDGPRRAPYRKGPARQLVVFLHGYGANGEDLIALADFFQRSLPHAAFVAPNAPEQLSEVVGGLQWFSLPSLDPDILWDGAQMAAGALDAFLDAELARHDLPPEALGLVGFSQGCVMALHVGLRRNVAPAAVIGFSGALAGPEQLADEIVGRPPVLLIHGADDNVVPAEAMDIAASAMAAAGVTVATRLRPRLGHGIDQNGATHAAAFLTAAFKAVADEENNDDGE